MMRLLSFFSTLLVALSCLLQDTSVRAQAPLAQARVSCNAAFNAPCSRTNVEWLAVTTANQLGSVTPIEDSFADVTAQVYNLDTGFYPFILDKRTSLCVAHGADSELVGLSLRPIFDRQGLHYADVSALFSRFVAAADGGGDFVHYLWSDNGTRNSKIAYITNVTEDYLLGVGYVDAQLPLDLPCSAAYDSWCSFTDVRSLLGKAQSRLNQATSVDQFEKAVHALSFDESFRLEEGFYSFLYHYDGRLKAHGNFQDAFGATLPEIVVQKGSASFSEGVELQDKFILAAEGVGNGWVQYPWRNSVDEATYTKISFLVKIEFAGDFYFLGVGYNFVLEPALEDTSEDACSDDFNAPCAFDATLRLTAHVQAHAVSSPLSVQDVFDAVNSDPAFRIGEFYAFIYDFNSTCVSHGADNSDNVGRTLYQVLENVGVSVDAALLHEQFRAAAERGGGYVLYDWAEPGVENSHFQKIAYLFLINLEGRNYYGGVGFNHLRAPVEIYADTGTTRSGNNITCSNLYGRNCSELNAKAIEGQAFAELILASSGARVTSGNEVARTLTDVLAAIANHQDDSFRVTDFFVMVFSVDGSECAEEDGSGCCLAHGADSTMVNRTWHQILTDEGITSIQGLELHRRLSQSSAGGGSIEYAWASNTKRAWSSRFRHEGKEFYVMAEYLKNPPPRSCGEGCLGDMECGSDETYCTDKSTGFIDNPMLIPLIVLFCVGTPSIAAYFWWRKWQSKKRALTKIKALKEQTIRMAEQLKQQMQGMVEVIRNLSFQTPEPYTEKAQEEAAAPTVAVVWYWEEDTSFIDRHKSSMVLSGTNFVSYSREVSGQLEYGFQLWQEGRGLTEFRVDLEDKVESSPTGNKVNATGTGSHYEVNFETLVQMNSKSKYPRTVRREEVPLSDDAVEGLPLLPDGIVFGDEGENLLPTYVGQVIQVSKVHPSEKWKFGNVLYDPVVERALKQHQASESSDDDGLNAVLQNALHDRPTSGWFPTMVTKRADVHVMKTLLGKLGGQGADTLKPPPTWQEGLEGKLEVPFHSPEYKEVTEFFMDAMYGQKGRVRVTKVERVQNLPLWQSYAVKKQTMKSRDAQHVVHNHDVERKWLFHGTRANVIDNIVKQGFNRAFAGRNAVRYGKGVYFARDACYSSHESFSQPDKGTQRMFLCRVAVGDWCSGTTGQLTPNPKPHNKLELFDTTCDNVKNPSIFVVYHDAQAFPEYLISFKGTT
jgi:poly [ADP-ribose] polymerase 10/14/15